MSLMIKEITYVHSRHLDQEEPRTRFCPDDINRLEKHISKQRVYCNEKNIKLKKLVGRNDGDLRIVCRDVVNSRLNFI